MVYNLRLTLAKNVFRLDLYFYLFLYIALNHIVCHILLQTCIGQIFAVKYAFDNMRLKREYDGIRFLLFVDCDWLYYILAN